MTAHRRFALACAAFSLFASFTLAAAFGKTAPDTSAKWIHAQYRAYHQFTLTCAVNLLCEIALEPGEQVRDGFNPDPADWDPHLAYEGTGATTPHLILTPRKAGLTENLIITTTRRVYRLFVTSNRSNKPTYFFFHYDAQNRAVASSARQRSATPPPFNPDTACAPGSRTYDVRGDKKWSPVLVCNDGAHTFMQMAYSSVIPTDLPVVFARVEKQDQLVNWTYDAPNRVYRVDGVFDHLILAAGRTRIDVIRKQTAASSVQTHS